MHSSPLRSATVLILLLALAPAARSAAQDGTAAARAGAGATAGVAAPALPAEREASAREFVRQNHPELDVLLDKLRPMNPAAYEKAIAELDQTRRGLAALQARDPRRYELALEVWKAKSRVERLAAQDSKARTPESESSLREAIASQYQAELLQRKFERDAAEARFKKLDAELERLEAERPAQIETRLRRLTKGRPVGKAAKAAAAAKGKGNPQGNEKP